MAYFKGFFGPTSGSAGEVRRYVTWKGSPSIALSFGEGRGVPLGAEGSTKLSRAEDLNPV